MHLEGLEEEVGLVTHALLQAFEFGAVEVILQDGGVIGVRTLLDNDLGTLARREATDISQALIRVLVPFFNCRSEYVLRGRYVPAR